MTTKKLTRLQEYHANVLINAHSSMPTDGNENNWLKYDADWSDVVVAERIDASEAQVRRLRIDVFGTFIAPKKPTPKEKIAALEAEVAALKAAQTGGTPTTVEETEHKAT